MWLFASTVSSICWLDKSFSLTPLGNNDNDDDNDYDDDDDDDDDADDDDDDDDDLIFGL